MKLFSIDVQIYGTMYVKAESMEEAKKIVASRRESQEIRLADSDQWTVNDEQYHRDMPTFSLSPSATYLGPQWDDELEEVEDFDEPDDAA